MEEAGTDAADAHALGADLAEHGEGSPDVGDACFCQLLFAESSSSSVSSGTTDFHVRPNGCSLLKQRSTVDCS